MTYLFRLAEAHALAPSEDYKRRGGRSHGQPSYHQAEPVPSRQDRCVGGGGGGGGKIGAKVGERYRRADADEQCAQGGDEGGDGVGSSK